MLIGFASAAVLAFASRAELPPATLHNAQALANAAADEASRDELRHEVAMATARQRRFAETRALAETLTPGRRAMVLLELAAHLPTSRRTEADQLLLDAQTAKSLTRDWRKARLARLLAVGYARLDHFEVAEALAHAVPDTEEKAVALQEVVAELCRAGQIAKARELAAVIEENRRYGTYRQKAAALAITAQTLHARGNPDDAATLLAQAELLLPKKPGWADAGAFVAVAAAAGACGDNDKSHALLARAEALAQSIGGPWKVSELARIAAAWRTCCEAGRARDRLVEAANFLRTLSPLERATESLGLSRAWKDAGEPKPARDTLLAVLKDADQAENQDAWRKPRVLVLLAWSDLFGDEPAASE
jgi:hypothetical protein